MFVEFFFELKRQKIPVTIREFLVFLESLEGDFINKSIDDFYILSRISLVKDEKYFDQFDQIFGAYFQGLMNNTAKLFNTEISERWISGLKKHNLNQKEREKLEKLDFDQIFEKLRARLIEQHSEHSGGNKWIGTGGTSPFGNNGLSSTGIRIGGEGGGGSAVKVWKKRQFRNLSGNVEVGTRNIKMALRQLRKFVREGAPDEFDLDDTILKTAKNAGLLNIQMRAKRRNKVKILLFIDVGGTMDSHIKVSEELFSSARSEFKYLEYYYFHNFIYERLWRDNRRGYSEYISTWDVLKKYSSDYNVIFVGDAVMSPYEVTEPGGSIEHWNDEAGVVWMNRMQEHFPSLVWLNPEPAKRWSQIVSTQLIWRLLQGRMFEMTLDGVEQATKALRIRDRVFPKKYPL
ncbi:MAG: hypothetical protein CMM44_04685 [Rhodospirillaceae bacterium]|nr:hypothetical protein [Rhodospirillaceae bacterium]|tara:strand:+ start:118 stop:1326 length:1209 start_codon:yes stop_codon:yes gene_type:complete